MINYGTVATKIFRVLKGNGYSIKTYTFDGTETVDPEEARWFYVVDPNMMVLLDDAEDEIKMNKNATLPLDVYGNCLTQIKAIARHYILNFTIRNFGKEVNPKEFSYIAKKKKKEQEKLNTVQESAFSKLRGSQKTSVQALEGVKIVVKHFESVSDEKRGDRSRKIKDIFIENNGNRQKLPIANLRCARAMARHVQNGGKFDDVLGEHIINTTLKLVDLVEFAKYTKKNKMVNEQSGEIMDMVREGINSMMDDLDSISKPSSYMSSKARIETQQNICEQEDTTQIKQLFTMEQIDSRVEKVLPTLGEMMSANKQKLMRIQEASLDTIFCDRIISENAGIEYASKKIKLGNDLLEMSSGIINNAELAGYLVKVGEKLISEGTLTDFEKQIVKNVFENITISKPQVSNTVKVAVEDRIVSSITESLKAMEKKLFEGIGDTQFEGYPNPVLSLQATGDRDENGYEYYTSYENGGLYLAVVHPKSNELTMYECSSNGEPMFALDDDAYTVTAEEDDYVVDESKRTESEWSTGVCDNPEYEYYVIIQTPAGVKKIESGWEFKEDATEHLHDINGFPAVIKHRSKMAASRMGDLDPNKDKNWATQDDLASGEKVEESIMEDMDAISELRDLGPRLKTIIYVVKNADTIEEWKYDKSQIELSKSVKLKIMRELETAVFRYNAARQGLGIANRLKDNPSRMKHKRRVMQNLNSLRAFVQKLERILKIKD